MKKFHYILGWIFVRPRRWLFAKMIWSDRLRLLPRHEEYFGWSWPNLHWWLLYRTVFKFCKWLNYDAWRPLCDWTGGYRRSYPWLARVIHKLGQTTAGYSISGGECHHCASDDGNQVELVDDETGTTFILEHQWTSATEDGTDHCFSGTTICPKCGYRDFYHDSSL